MNISNISNFSAHSYAVNVAAETQVGDNFMMMEFFDQNGHKYRKSLRMYKHPGLILSIPSTVAPSRITRAHIVYYNSYSLLLGTPYVFVTVNARITYLSNLNSTIRAKYSSILCANNLLVKSYTVAEYFKPMRVLPSMNDLLPKQIIVVPLSEDYCDNEYKTMSVDLVDYMKYGAEHIRGVNSPRHKTETESYVKRYEMCFVGNQTQLAD